MNLNHGSLVPDPKVGLIGAVGRFLADPGALVSDKAIFILGIVYVVSPIDILPEGLLPILGFADDLLVLTKLAHMAFAAKKVYGDARPFKRTEVREI